MRKVPGAGFAERSSATRKISVAFENETMDYLIALASSRGVSIAEVVREHVAAARCGTPHSEGGSGGRT